MFYKLWVALIIGGIFCGGVALSAHNRWSNEFVAVVLFFWFVVSCMLMAAAADDSNPSESEEERDGMLNGVALVSLLVLFYGAFCFYVSRYHVGIDLGGLLDLIPVTVERK